VLRLGGKVKAANADSLTPIHIAASLGRLDGVRALVNAGASPVARDGLGNTPMHLAAQYGHAAVVGLLLSLGAPPLDTNEDGCTPFVVAIRHGHACVLPPLIRTGKVSVNRRADFVSPLTLAARHGAWEVMGALLDAGAVASAVDDRDAVAGTSMRGLPASALAMVRRHFPHAHVRTPAASNAYDDAGREAAAALYVWLRAVAWERRRAAVVAMVAGGPLGHGDRPPTAAPAADDKPWWRFWG
jgi:ankyrin repeat protein